VEVAGSIPVPPTKCPSLGAFFFRVDAC